MTILSLGIQLHTHRVQNPRSFLKIPFSEKLKQKKIPQTLPGSYGLPSILGYGWDRKMQQENRKTEDVLKSRLRSLKNQAH